MACSTAAQTHSKQWLVSNMRSLHDGKVWRENGRQAAAAACPGNHFHGNMIINKVDIKVHLVLLQSVAMMAANCILLIGYSLPSLLVVSQSSQFSAGKSGGMSVSCHISHQI